MLRARTTDAAIHTVSRTALPEMSEGFGLRLRRYRTTKYSMRNMITANSRKQNTMM